jgi:tetratricopeptide (TPR) repeat protein
MRALTLESDGRVDEAGNAFRAAWSLDPRNPVKAYYAAQRGSGGALERERARAVLTDAYRDMKFDAAPAMSAVGHASAIPDNRRARRSSPTARPLAASPASRGEVRRSGGGAREAGSRRPREVRISARALTRGQRDEAGNRVADARREYQAALAGALAGRSVLLVAIARLAQVEGDAAGAIDALAQAARINPNDPNVHKELAAAYAAEGRADDAFSELMAVVLIDRRDAQTHASIGQLYLDTGRNTDAVAAFGRALELRPAGYEVRYALATAHTRLGNTAEAARQLEIYDRLRREALEKRRRDIANEVEQEERRRGKRNSPPGKGGRRTFRNIFRVSSFLCGGDLFSVPPVPSCRASHSSIHRHRAPGGRRVPPHQRRQRRQASRRDHGIGRGVVRLRRRRVD